MKKKSLPGGVNQKRCSSLEMSLGWVYWVSPYLWALIISLSLLCAVTVSVSLADPPDKKTCDGDVFERLECRHGGVGEQIEFMGGIYLMREGRCLRN